MRSVDAMTVYDDKLIIETPEAVAFNLELAGIGSRGVAFLLDQLILALILIGEALLLLGSAAIFTNLFTGDASEELLYGTVALGLLLWFVTTYGYHLFYEVRRGGRTPGKRIAGIRVAREDGGRVTFGASAIRNLLRIIDVMPSAYLVGVTSVVLSRQRQRVGDMAAGTVVIYEPKERPLELGEALVSNTTELAHDYLRRREALSAAARDMVAREVLLTLGEQPGDGWDEPVIAGRIADLVGARRPVTTPTDDADVSAEAPAAPDEDDDAFFTGTA